MPYASREQIAHLLKLTPRMVNMHVKDHGMPSVGRGQYDMVACVHWYVDFLRSEIFRARRGDETEQQARTRLIKASANLRERELEREEGRLIEVDSVKVQWERIAIAFKNKILVLPSKLPQKLISCQGMAEIKSMLETELYEALSELKALDIPPPDGIEGVNVREPKESYPVNTRPTRSTPKAKGERVGGSGEGTLTGVKRRARKVENGSG